MLGNNQSLKKMNSISRVGIERKKVLVSVSLKLKQLDLCLQNKLRNRLKAAFELASKWWYVCKETVFYWCECGLCWWRGAIVNVWSFLFAISMLSV